jgi:hypothetical protein
MSELTDEISATVWQMSLPMLDSEAKKTLNAHLSDLLALQRRAVHTEHTEPEKRVINVSFLTANYTLEVGQKLPKFKDDILLKIGELPITAVDGISSFSGCAELYEMAERTQTFGMVFHTDDYVVRIGDRKMVCYEAGDSLRGCLRQT